MKEKSNEQLRIGMSEENEAARENKRVILIDGMAVVNRMNKGQDILVINLIKSFSRKVHISMKSGRCTFR